MSALTAPSSGEDGFSILEMIVAMTILALVLGIASQSIVIASRGIAVAKAQVEAARTVRAMLADYQANAGLQANAPADPTRSGWTLNAREIEISRAKITAIIIEKTGAGAGAPFLTFVPARDVGTQ